jgi:hypothetical protein
MLVLAIDVQRPQPRRGQGQPIRRMGTTTLSACHNIEPAESALIRKLRQEMADTGLLRQSTHSTPLHERWDTWKEAVTRIVNDFFWNEPGPQVR